MSAHETDAGRFWTEDSLSALARDLVLAMMASASTERIKPVDWWDRAKTSLVAATERATTWGQLVDTMASKLEIETLRGDSARAICSMALAGADFRRFRQVVKSTAVYIVAEARVIRDAERASKESIA